MRRMQIYSDQATYELPVDFNRLSHLFTQISVAYPSMFLFSKQAGRLSTSISSHLFIVSVMYILVDREKKGEAAKSELTVQTHYEVYLGTDQDIVP